MSAVADAVAGVLEATTSRARWAAWEKAHDVGQLGVGDQFKHPRSGQVMTIAEDQGEHVKVTMGGVSGRTHTIVPKTLKPQAVRKRVREAGVQEASRGGLVKCPECGTLNGKSSAKCKNCGHDMKQVAAEAKSDGRSNVREAIAVVLEGEPAKGDGKGKGGRRAGRTRRGKFADLPTLATGKRAAKPDNPSAQGAAEGSGPTAVAEAVALALGGEPEATAADVAEVAAVLEALNHESLNRSPRKNWVERAGQLPAAIQHMAKDIHEERGLPLDQAIPIAISQAKKLAAKGNAKYAAAVAEWEKLKATSRVQQSALTEAILGTLGP